MSGVSSSQSSQPARTKELLADIAAHLGVDVSVFSSPRLQTTEATKPSERETARLVLAFAKVPDACRRDRIVELVEAQVGHEGGVRRTSAG